MNVTIMRTLIEWIWERIPHELQRRGDIEDYDKVMEQRPNYFKILYNRVLRYKK